MATIASRHKTADRLHCERGGEWKTCDQFSISQLARYSQNVRQGIATPQNSGISCQEHTGRPTNEIKCKGPCGRWRDVRFYSKNTRKKGQDICLDCGSYHRFLEVGQSLPPPNSQRSVDEFNLTSTSGYLTSLPTGNTQDSDGEYSSSEDDDEDVPSARSRIVPNTNNSSVTSATQALANLKVDAQEDYQAEVPPTHLPAPAVPKAPHWFLPPLQDSLTGTGLATGTSGSRPTASSAYGSSAATTRAPANGQGSNEEKVFFNAWGPNGEFARKIKTPTVASTTTLATSSARTDRGPKKGGWAKVPSRKYPPMLPDYLKGDQEVVEDHDSDDSEDGQW